ncbi:MAG: hypothetical protein ABI577_07915 [bacterium]
MTHFKGGDRVYTSDGKLLGTVTETRGDLFKLDVPLAVDYWLRTDEVVQVEHGSVLMNFSEADMTHHRIEAGAA